MKRAAALLLLLPVLALAAGMPERARKYERPLIANARAVWGLGAPIATLAGQIHQESGWREDAKSAYAAGLAQFTPATADWISGAYRSQLGAAAPFNPAWALRALVIYDKQLFDGMDAADACEGMAFALSAYNGGLGNLKRDSALCKAATLGISCARSSSDSQGSLMGFGEGNTGLTLADFDRENGAGLGAMFAPKEMVVRSKPSMHGVVLSMRHPLEIVWQEVASILVSVMYEVSPREIRHSKDFFGYQPVDIPMAILGTNGRVVIEHENALLTVQSDPPQDATELGWEVFDQSAAFHVQNVSDCACDSRRWWDNVENYSKRASWAFQENRGYPRVIIRHHQQIYAAWGPGVCT